MNAPFDSLALRTTLRKMGNSTGLILPKPILDQLGLSSGAKMELRLEDGKVIVAPVKRKVREGWEEAAKLIGAEGLTDEEREWLEFDDPVDGDVPREWLTDDPDA
ncbi:MAG TPA: AbrB/MazE/SpoVT family DNA-binding domain-containing protein [Novosphingobium sp.]|nr:AbrB/MazE/SpoVT family DNA-binding domain-containing protein [Novosphingobium sp.]